MTRLAALILFVLGWFSIGCTTHYDVAEHAVQLRLSADGKALLILEVERGIATDPKRSASALHALERALQGGKCFPPEQGFPSIDFDRANGEDSEDFTEEELAASRELAANVTIQAVHVFRDDRKALCFARLTRVDDLERSFAIVNAWLNRVLSRSRDRETAFEAQFPIYDEATWNSVGRSMRSGHAWFSVRDGAIVLDIPMTESNAARCLKAISEREIDDSMFAVLRQMSSLRVADGHALLRFSEPNQPILRFASKPEQGPVDESLQSALRAQGVLIRGPEDLARMIASFEAPAKVDGEPK